MTRLYIGSMTDFSGKSLLSIGIGLLLKNRGFTVGYIKPIGRDPVRVGNLIADADAFVAKDALELEESSRVISPFMLDFDATQHALSKKTEMLDAVVQSIKAVKGKDAVIIEGMSTIFDGSMVYANGVQIVRAVDARALMIEGWKGDATINLLLCAADIFGKYLAGAVINMVPAAEMAYVKKTVRPFLAKNRINMCGIVKKDEVLGSVTVRQLRDVLNGKVLCCEDMLDERVEQYLVGAMDVHSAMRYFRRTPNKAVITGGHRSDIQLAALETSTKCLILTGGLSANDIIISRAEALGVPVLSVSLDTFSAIDKIESILGKTHIRGNAQIGKAFEVVETSIDFPLLAKAAGLKRPR
ncbi:MAG: DRTGG domain-containing protein [bacterium]